MDAVFVGRVGVDLYAREYNCPLSAVKTFSKHLGGCTANSAVGLSRLGKRVGLVSGVGNDAFGDFVLDFLKSENVDTTRVKRVPVRRTSLAVVEISPPSAFPTIFYRAGCADLQLQKNDIDAEYLLGAKLIFCSGASLAESPSRETILWALGRAREGGVRTAFDIDYRPQLWADERDAALYCAHAASLSEIVFGNEEEVGLLSGRVPLQSAASSILSLGPRIFAAKRGADGAYVFTKEGSYFAAPCRVKVLSALGAGDAFAASFCYGILEGWELAKCTQFGNAAGAKVASQLGCSDAMPSLREVQDFIASNSPHAAVDSQ